LEEAITAYRQAMALKAGLPDAHFNLSLALLATGALAEGRQEYEWRLKGGVKELRPRKFAQPRWAGENFSGKTVLLHAEQGLGDTLQFARFADAVASHGGKVVLGSRLNYV
jgi:hypothetical protein